MSYTGLLFCAIIHIKIELREWRMRMTLLDQILLLVTGLLAIYLLWRFYGRYREERGLYDIYYMLGFAVLLVSGLLLIFLGIVQ